MTRAATGPQPHSGCNELCYVIPPEGQNDLPELAEHSWPGSQKVWPRVHNPPLPCPPTSWDSTPLAQVPPAPSCCGASAPLVGALLHLAVGSIFGVALRRYKTVPHCTDGETEAPEQWEELNVKSTLHTLLPNPTTDPRTPGWSQVWRLGLPSLQQKSPSWGLLR